MTPLLRQNTGLSVGFYKGRSCFLRVTLPHKASEHTFPCLKVFRPRRGMTRPVLQQHFGRSDSIANKPASTTVLAGMNRNRIFPTTSHDAPELGAGRLVP